MLTPVRTYCICMYIVYMYVYAYTYYTRMMKISKFNRKLSSYVGIELNSATKVRKQGIRFWDERTFWHEIIYKSLIANLLK